MNTRGFTLIELLIVIALVGILGTIGTFAFSRFSTKSHIANQTEMLYGDLVEYRTKALYEKKNWTFKISPARYGIYSSAVTSVEPVSTVICKYLIVSNITYITFDSHGLTNNSGTACVDNANDAVVDSVVVSKTRIKMGKKKGGTPCAAGNIIAK